MEQLLEGSRKEILETDWGRRLNSKYHLESMQTLRGLKAAQNLKWTPQISRKSSLVQAEGVGKKGSTGT